ncbi:MAG: hypothetical protein GY805_11165 [Chloroflexi bacterium]|nr:hypothetical protein [Chloroflexota bacterium]
MERKSKSRLLIGGLILFSALIAIYTFWVFLNSENPTQDWQAFLLNVSTELIGALIVFFFFNLFFFLDDWDLSERVTRLLHRLERDRPLAENFFQKTPDIEPLIKEAKAIDLCGVSLTTTISRQVPLLRDSLEEGKAIRLLIIDPRSIAVQMANARSETQDITYYNKRLEASLSDIAYLQKKWEEFNKSENPSSFTVGLMPYAPSFGIQIFHKEKMKGKMYVEMYTHHGGYGTQPLFTLDELDDSNWYKFFNSQFEEIWKKSTAWTPQIQIMGKKNGVPELSIAKADDFLFENNPDLAPYFQKATDIRLFGIDLSGVIRLHLDSIAKSLEQENTSLKVIITSEQIYSSKQKDSIEALKWLITNPKIKGTVQVHEYDEQTHYALFATDPLLTKGRMQIKMYTQFWSRYKSPSHYKSPKFELFQDRDPYWMEYFLTQFDLLWEQSKPILSSLDQKETNDEGSIDGCVANNF